MSKPKIPQIPVDAIRRVVKYLHTEERHYWDCVTSGGDCSDHIWPAVEDLALYLEEARDHAKKAQSRVAYKERALRAAYGPPSSQ